MTNFGGKMQLTIAAAMMAMVLLDSVPLRAQARASRFIFSIAAGPAVFPMSEWRDYSESWINSRYVNQQISMTGKITVGLHINPRSSINLEVEQLVSKGAHFFYPYLDNPSGPDLPLQINVTHWTFTGVPVTLAYLHHFRNPTSRWTPYVGLGLSYYFSEVETEYDLLYDPFLEGYAFAEETARTDAGYGYVVVVGMNVPMVGRLNITPQLRYRWADASAFGDPNKVAISFTGYDFSIGLSWNP